MKLFGRKRKSSRGLPNYWNESVIEPIQRDARVDRETARTWFNEMLVFLDMVADSKKFISPPEAIDVAWHAFILHTRDYEDYCRERFGRVIHHQPTGAADPDAYRRAHHQRSATGGPVDNSVRVIPPRPPAAWRQRRESRRPRAVPTSGRPCRTPVPAMAAAAASSATCSAATRALAVGDSGGGSGDSGGGGSSCGGGGCGGGGG
jgi:hypothetical protein